MRLNDGKTHACMRLQQTLRLIEDEAKRTTKSYETIAVEDGSTDGTDEIAAEIAHNDPKIANLHSDPRLGKGEAL